MLENRSILWQKFALKSAGMDGVRKICIMGNVCFNLRDIWPTLRIKVSTSQPLLLWLCLIATLNLWCTPLRHVWSLKASLTLSLTLGLLCTALFNQSIFMPDSWSWAGLFTCSEALIRHTLQNTANEQNNILTCYCIVTIQCSLQDVINCSDMLKLHCLKQGAFR